MALYEFCTLHLKSEYIRKTFDPSRLRCPVALTILLVLVVCNFTPENVFPRLVKVSFVLDIQYNIVHHIILRLSLRQTFFVDEFNQVFHMTLEHFLKLSLLYLIFFD